MLVMGHVRRWRLVVIRAHLHPRQVTPRLSVLELHSNVFVGLASIRQPVQVTALHARQASLTRKQLVSLSVLLVLTVKRLLMARLPVALQRQHATLALLDTSIRVKNVMNALQALIQAWGLLNALIARQDTPRVIGKLLDQIVPFANIVPLDTIHPMEDQPTVAAALA